MKITAAKQLMKIPHKTAYAVRPQRYYKAVNKPLTEERLNTRASTLVIKA